jgi:hypothetical protein
MDKFVSRIGPEPGEDVRWIMSLPGQATSGIAVVGGSVYFGCGAELWQYRLEEGGAK